MTDIDVNAIRRKNEIAAAQKLAAANTVVEPEPAPPPKPKPAPAPRQPHWIAVERVMFREDGSVDIPGRDLSIYSGKDNVVEVGARGRSLVIWLDRPASEIILEHPESCRLERVPMSNVRSYRLVGDVPPQDSMRPVGMVDRLPDEPAPKQRWQR